MMNSTATSAKPASERTVAFVRSLASERQVPVAGKSSREAQHIARLEDMLEEPMTRFVAQREASAVIDWLKSLPRQPREDSPQPELGVYVMPDGTLVLAKPNKSGTNVYTMRFVDSGDRVVDASGDWARGDWEYEPALKFQLGTARKMTAAEAKAFILRYGKCPRCSHKLKAASSVERGIGPVCRNYWPDWEEQFAS